MSQSSPFPASGAKYAGESTGQRNGLPSCQTSRVGRSSERSCLSRQAEREASNHADRAEAAALSGEVDEALGRGASEGERLLAEHVLSVLEERAHLLGVRDRRGGDDRELVRALEHSLPARRDRACRQQGGDLRRPCRLTSKSRTAPTQPPASRRASAGA